MAKTIIVGAGINGLLLGALLAHDGDEVVVFEKSRRVGGRAFLLKKGGFSVDYGIHLTRFGPKSAVAAILRRIGHVVRFRKLGASYVHDGGMMKLFPTSPGGIFKSDLFTFREKLQILGLLVAIKRGRYDELMGVSLGEWMKANGVGGGIRTYFELVSASVMVCPFVEKTSAGEMFRNLRKVLSTGHSAEYPIGGWEPIHDALLETIGRSGGIVTGAKVEAVVFSGRKAVGVKVGGKIHRADRVVINAPVQQAIPLFPAKLLAPGYAALCKKLVPTSGVFVDAALDSVVSQLSGLFYTIKPAAYGCITSNLSPGIAPEGKQLLTMFYPTSLGDMRDRAVIAKRKKELWAAVRRCLPGIEKHLLWKRECALAMIDGVQVNVDQTEDKRPGVRVPGLEGVFLVGDSVAAPGAGGDVGNESVLLAFREITGKSV
ncbi:MAG TPA: FAD-dependent oxidoreductase [Spirochaetota bacterium]|nr:FAD-dependent oxidoreductase [Spirochaetota bacterium]